MKLEKNRELEYKEKVIDIPHPFVKYKKIIFKFIILEFSFTEC